MRRRGIKLGADCWTLKDGRRLLDLRSSKIPMVEELGAGALNDGWLIGRGAGLLEWAKKTHPARKLNKDAMVNQMRSPNFKGFIPIIPF